MFTRRHYEAVARVLRDAALDDEARHALAQDFAAMFAADNPRFHAGKFREACGGRAIAAAEWPRAAE
jgi:hypothetical protein